MEHQDSEQLYINTIRVLSADQPSAAKSGHPGAPLGMAPMAYLLWTKYMHYNPTNPSWFNRDRFVLSNGHACALLYSMLHLTGYNVSLDDLKAFRQVGSKTPGHPESHITEGVEVSTGPLGQGITNAVGLSIASNHYAAVYNKPDFKIINNNIWVFCGDGCLQEGISSEGCSLAGHLGLGNLRVLYDDNHVTIDGDTNLSFTEDVGKRFEAYGWHVINVSDVNDIPALSKAIDESLKVTDRPVLIKVRTIIGYGSAKAGTKDVHGSPLTEEDLQSVKKKFGFDPSKKFFIPEEAQKFFSGFSKRGKDLETEWNNLLGQYAQKYPDLAKELKRRIAEELPAGWDDLPGSKVGDPPSATRQLSGTVINKLALTLPDLMGGSADLNPSNLTYLKNSIDYQKNTPHGTNIRFGVREHAMAAICNGLAAYGGVIPFCSTFLNFIGYALGAVTVSAVSKCRVLYIMTHDSVGLGEDGPTHQPVEKFMLCRLTPNLLFLRPCDGNEVAASYIAAINHKHGPTVIALSRQNVIMQKGTSMAGVLKGAYPIHNDPEGKPDVIIVSTGSEVQIATQAADKLTDLKVRVVSMPSWELFDAQPLSYKEEVFLPGVPVVSFEAGVTKGWERYAHGSIGVDRFGISGPTEAVYKALGLTTDNIVKKVREAVEFYKTNPVPNILRKPFDSSL